MKFEPPPCPIPERNFVGEEEPIGVWVTLYHKPCTIRKILNAFYATPTKLIIFAVITKFTTEVNLDQNTTQTGFFTCN